MTATGRPGSGAPGEGAAETGGGAGDVRTLALLGGLVVMVPAALLASVATPAPHTGGDNAAS